MLEVTCYSALAMRTASKKSRNANCGLKASELVGEALFKFGTATEVQTASGVSNAICTGTWDKQEFILRNFLKVCCMFWWAKSIHVHYGSLQHSQLPLDTCWLACNAFVEV